MTKKQLIKILRTIKHLASEFNEEMFHHHTNIKDKENEKKKAAEILIKHYNSLYEYAINLDYIDKENIIFQIIPENSEIIKLIIDSALLAAYVKEDINSDEMQTKITLKNLKIDDTDLTQINNETKNIEIEMIAKEEEILNREKDILERQEELKKRKIEIDLELKK